jgi:hypothetical protein
LNYSEIRNIFIKLFNDLNNESIKIIEKSDAFDLISKEEKEMVLNSIETRYKVSLNNIMKEILIPKLSVCWYYNIRGNLETGGEFNLRGTNALLVDTSKTSFSDSLTKYGKKLYKEGYRFLTLTRMPEMVFLLQYK